MSQASLSVVDVSAPGSGVSVFEIVFPAVKSIFKIRRPIGVKEKDMAIIVSTSLDYVGPVLTNTPGMKEKEAYMSSARKL